VREPGERGDFEHREQIGVESSRIVDRLNGMPINRVDDAVRFAVRDAAQRVVDRTADPARPTDASVPALGPSGLAAQVAVVVADYLRMATAASSDAAVAEVLTDLRRLLP
jgi:hypothetical protein